MERQGPETTSNEIELYIRTYYSLLRSTGDVRVRSFEESHSYSQSSLHEGARDPKPDISAFGYAAARLPECMPQVHRLVLGQSPEQFESFDYAVQSWERVQARGRRRPLRYDGQGTLAAFVASASDIDDLIPMVTTYQIEWNKMHTLLNSSSFGRKIAAGEVTEEDEEFDVNLAEVLGLSKEEIRKLRDALGEDCGGALRRIAAEPSDRRVQLLAGSFSLYQTAAQRWWSGIEPLYLSKKR